MVKSVFVDITMKLMSLDLKSLDPFCPSVIIEIFTYHITLDVVCRWSRVSCMHYLLMKNLWSDYSWKNDEVIIGGRYSAPSYSTTMLLAMFILFYVSHLLGCFSPYEAQIYYVLVCLWHMIDLI